MDVWGDLRGDELFAVFVGVSVGDVVCPEGVDFLDYGVFAAGWFKGEGWF